MERKRRRLLGLLARVEKLGETGQAWRLRDQNMRRLGMSIFFNSQLQAGLDREVAVLEKEHDTSPPDSGKRYPIFAWKQMQSIEDRIQQLEGILLASDEEVAEETDEPPPPSPESSEEEAQPPPAQ